MRTKKPSPPHIDAVPRIDARLSVPPIGYVSLATFVCVEDPPEAPSTPLPSTQPLDSD